MFDDCCAQKKVRRTRGWLIFALLLGALIGVMLESVSTTSPAPTQEIPTGVAR